MIEATSSLPASHDAPLVGGRRAESAARAQPLVVDPELVATLHRAAALVRAGAIETAEREILHRLVTVTDIGVSAYALDAISFVRELDVASLAAGPVLTPDPTRFGAPSAPRRSGPRLDYAHAITTALRVRLQSIGAAPR